MSRLKERIENFNKAFELLKSAVEAYDPNTILTHLALVQAYEVCFELAWKVLKDYMETKGVLVYYPKDVIKEAFNKETIQDGQLWIKMLDDRNSTSHEYKMDKVNAILDRICTIYYNELLNFQANLEKLV